MIGQRLEYPREVFARTFAGMDSGMRDWHLDILEAVFFASMMQEEGEFVPIAVVVDHDSALEDVEDSNPEREDRGDDYDNRAWFVLRLKPIELTPRSLKRIANGVEYGRDLVVVGLQDQRLLITGIARRRVSTDGGNALRIAAPRPGVLLLEGYNRQLGVRYEVGTEVPADVEVFYDEGPVLSALRACGLGDHAWRLAETLRYARATHAGAMFLCLPSATADSLDGTFAYRFSNPAALAELAKKERQVLFRRIAAVRQEYDASALANREALRAEADGNRERAIAAIEMLGRLAANDGAVVIEPGFHVAGSGFIIAIREDDNSVQPASVVLCRNAAGTDREERRTSGGARHAAGIRFAWSNEGAVVFIVSADGPVTCVLRVANDVLTWSVRLPET